MIKGEKTNSLGCPKVAILELSELEEAKYNPRTIEKASFEGLKTSISKFGCVEPIIVNIRSGKKKIIGGYQRYKALLEEGIKKCLCVTVNLPQTEEKLLNLSLNNPQIQGQFIETIGEYIDELRSELGGNQEFLTLRIEQLRKQIAGQMKETLNYSEEELKPFKRTHILLSFSPEKLSEIHEHLTKIIKSEGIEYEQCSN